MKDFLCYKEYNCRIFHSQPVHYTPNFYGPYQSPRQKGERIIPLTTPHKNHEPPPFGKVARIHTQKWISIRWDNFPGPIFRAPRGLSLFRLLSDTFYPTTYASCRVTNLYWSYLRHCARYWKMPPSLGTEPINYTRVRNTSARPLCSTRSVSFHLFARAKVTNWFQTWFQRGAL